MGAWPFEDDEWYYVFNNSGSTPWVRVQAQYDFITGNTNDNRVGPYGEERYLCYVLVGDIVQLYEAFSDDTWDHEGILVSASTVGNCSDLNNYKIDSHTRDRYQDTLAVWAVYPMRFIHINGYRLNITIPTRFSDVPSSHWAMEDIDRLYNSGITGGCNGTPPMYCPGNNVLRSQMAIFLVRAIHGDDFVPPTATGIFEDVPVGSFGADFIEQLKADGITGGCSTAPLKYCPNNSVIHAQMAIFLLRSKHGASYVPPGVAIAHFVDVPFSHSQLNWIEQLAREGISYSSHNCSSGNFCPNALVTRAEMASMMARAFDLP